MFFFGLIIRRCENDILSNIWVASGVLPFFPLNLGLCTRLLPSPLGGELESEGPSSGFFSESDVDWQAL